MRILFFDTMTSDLAGKANAYLMQFAVSIRDYSDPEHPSIITELSSLVKCPVEPSKGAYKVHGLNKHATRGGMKIDTIIKWFKYQVQQADIVVAHNVDYDIRMLCLEAMRLSVELGFPYAICTKKESIDLCRIPKLRGSGFKWPRLEKALAILCNHKLENTHDALTNTRGCEMLFRELVKRGRINL